MLNRIPKVLSSQFDPQFLKVGEKLYQQHAYKNFDFIRNSFCVQVIDDRGVHWAHLKKKKDKDNFEYSCDCTTFIKNMRCQHIVTLLYLVFPPAEKPESIYDNISRKYLATIWEILAKESFELHQNSASTFSTIIDQQNKQLEITCTNKDDAIVFRCQFPMAYWWKLWKKYRSLLFAGHENEMEKLLKSIDDIAYNGRDFLQPEKTELEERMNLAGYKSWRQKFEDSYWFDFSKMWYLTIDERSLNIDYETINQCLVIYSTEKDFVFYVQKSQVAAILKTLDTKQPLKQLAHLSDEKVKLNYSLEITDTFDLKITPVLKIPGQEQPLAVNNSEDLQVAVFGKYLYLKSLGFFPFEREITYFDSSLFGFREVLVPNDRILDIITEYKKAIDNNRFYFVSPSLLSENFITKIDSAKVIVSEIHRDWCYLDIKYRIEDETLTFADIYHAMKNKRRYLIGKKNWIDLQSPQLEWIFELQPDQIEQISKRTHRIKLSKLNFFKMRSFLPKKNQIVSQDQNKVALEKLLTMKPENDVPLLEKGKYTLRDYQKTGYSWLWFLYENGFSGLLCDDMGLGKTYESLALLDAITRVHKKAKFLVVCPTSVISHWRDTLTKFKKRVKLHIYYGTERNLNEITQEKYTVVLTSYGIMRNDLEVLEKIPFEVMIFDEIQSAKNKASLTNAALTQLKGKMKIGLTGTPIENNLFELKALFDIILPGYLGSDIIFKRKYLDPIEHEDKIKQEQLNRIINPFTLRRTKSQVLEELPPKIEEVRKCELSQEQVQLYKVIIANRADTVVQQLRDKSNDQIPYIHIFSILNYLKQICNHPAQLEKNNLDYKKYQSGKWDLFCELLEESLNSGFKVVVFSQYLNMLALIEAYLKDLGIEFATIKGATKNRGEMVDRFNNDPKCMVFTASLKAAGLGINLIGGSVVIHYDRWWNAAREDQATDRVHRIGQTRGVQVFKLITEGTLEEKIDRLIQKKKNLMENLVKIDDAFAIKTFDRDELIDLLTY